MTNSDPQRETLLRTIESRGALAGRFEDVRRLGVAGGDGHFSLLMIAVDRQSGKAVGLKFFHPGHMRNQYRWNCFLREPKLLQQFAGQPDILQCLAPHDEFTVPFIHMGLTLDIPFAYYAVELASYDVNQAISANRWSPMQKLEAFRAMCRAVQRIHNHSIVHRDLKPSNFLVMADGTLRLSDFGTARDLSDSAGGLLANYQAPPGDVWYAAPEIIAALHDVDPKFALRADIYSLGAVLFELFTGTPLNLHMFDPGTLETLGQMMNTVARADRIRIYDGFVGNMADAHPLPSLHHFGDVVPSCILSLANLLCRGMAAVDYRRRLCDFEDIFSRINTCLWVLKHEAAYHRWRELRARMRQAREEKRLLASAKMAALRREL